MAAGDMFRRASWFHKLTRSEIGCWGSTSAPPSLRANSAVASTRCFLNDSKSLELRMVPLRSTAAVAIR